MLLELRNDGEGAILSRLPAWFIPVRSRVVTTFLINEVAAASSFSFAEHRLGHPGAR
jgi:hypothetical protein